MKRAITILGASGSIGLSTLDVIARHPDKYDVFALTAHTQWERLAELCLVHKPRFAVMGDASSAQLLQKQLREQRIATEVLHGENALCEVASHVDVHIVMAAIVGAAGLLPTLSAAETGKQILLANKEALVMAGGLFTRAVKQNQAQLLPIDSEHNAIFQCLPLHERTTLEKGLAHKGVRRILLTASGGPFRTWPMDALADVTPEQACAHPNWDMGRKISVDSASMMNKGLELIEACWLFDARPEQIEVVIHPQSVVHSMVDYVDGSVLAHMGHPDMRTPIAHALAWPERIESGVSKLDLLSIGQLDFEAPDEQRFPCLALAREAALAGGTAPASLNAANEVAVSSFLEGRLSFDQIPTLVRRVLDRISVTEPEALDVVQHADREARTLAQTLVEGP